LLYASSSSVYGMNSTSPYRATDNVDHPVSLYAATKKANELMAHAYSNLYGLPTTGLRFFTVYGPWGRPDMAYYLFAKAISAGDPIPVYNNGEMYRDFTYIDDVVTAVLRLISMPPTGVAPSAELNPSTSTAPYRVLNVGNQHPVKLLEMIELLEEALGARAVVDFQPMQPGDVYSTCADVADLVSLVDYAPNTTLREGLSAFVSWYRSYHG